MYTTCLFCTKHLGANAVIETFPVGRRLAFDAERGRLWVVCRRCERWNLTPLEERWEAVEDCERWFRAARKRVSSDNIGLARLDEGLELVRIGQALRPEFAAWRYGDQFGRRRRRAMLYGAAGAVVVGGVVVGGAATGVLSGGGWAIYQVADSLLKLLRDRRTVARIPRPGATPLTVRGKHLDSIRLEPDPAAAAGWVLRLRHAGGRTVLTDDEASSAASLIMPKINSAGASRRRIADAVRRIEDAGGPVPLLGAAAREAQSVERFSGLSTRRARRRGSIKALPVETRLAIEMAVNEEHERIAMAGELALLELAWKEAEEVAAIADSLLVPDYVEDFLQQHRPRDPASGAR